MNYTFTSFIGTCMLDELFKFLLPLLSFRNIHECEDLCNLLVCNKNINSNVMNKCIHYAEIPLSIMQNWEEKKFNNVKRVFIDSSNIFRTINDKRHFLIDIKQILFKYKKSSSNIKEIAFD